jgi:DNA-binding transcriptional ArsR family regulator
MTDIFSLIKIACEPNRLRILCILSRAEICVCELESILGLSQPLISTHLKVLKGAGLVRERREGKWIYWFLNPSIWQKEKSWLMPIIKRFRKAPSSNKDERFLARCLCRRVDGKCIARFQ